MKCPHCNQEHPDEFLFCPITGNKIETAKAYTNVSLHEYDSIDSFHEGRAIVGKDGKYGAIDINGNEIVPCIYSKLLRYSEGLAACQIDTDGWAFIDLNGQLVLRIAEGLDVISEIGFSEGLCAVFGTIEYDDDCELKYGYIDKTGQLCIRLQYDYAADFHENIAWVSDDDEEGDSVQYYINKMGEKVFPYDYWVCHDFIGNYAIVKAMHGKWFVIDKHGQIIFKSPDKEYHWYGLNEGFIHYGQNGKLLWFRPEEQNKRYFWNNVKYLYSGVSEGYIALCTAESEKWGFITDTGKEAIPFIYDEAHNFKGGLAAVKMNGLWGFVDYNGMMVIKPTYDEVFDFNESRSIVQINNGWKVIDKKGNIIVG